MSRQTRRADARANLYWLLTEGAKPPRKVWRGSSVKPARYGTHNLRAIRAENGVGRPPRRAAA